MVPATVTFALLFFLVDFLWLGFIARDFYRTQLAGLIAENVNLPAAGAFYILYTLGVAMFVLAPALEAQSVQEALMMGGFFGLVAYGAYDLTNLAVVKDFPTKMALVDMVWGAVLTGTSAAVATFIALNFPKM